MIATNAKKLSHFLQLDKEESDRLFERRIAMRRAAIIQPDRRKEKRFTVKEWRAANELRKLEKTNGPITLLETPTLYSLHAECSVSGDDTALKRVEELAQLAFKNLEKSRKIRAANLRAVSLLGLYFVQIKKDSDHEPSRDELWQELQRKFPEEIEDDKSAKSRAFRAAGLTGLKTSQGRSRKHTGEGKGCSLNDDFRRLSCNLLL